MSLIVVLLLILCGLVSAVAANILATTLDNQLNSRISQYRFASRKLKITLWGVLFFVPLAVLTLIQNPIKDNGTRRWSVPPESQNEMLIVVFPFHNSTNVVDTEIHQKIRRGIENNANRLSISQPRIRVETGPIALASDERSKAEAIGKKPHASILIWGEDTGVEVIVNVLNLKAPNINEQLTTISEIERSQLANPSEYAHFVTRDLPGQISFLSLYPIGLTLYNQGQFAESIKVIEQSVASLSTTEKPSVINLSPAYFCLGSQYYKLHELDKAIMNYTIAIGLDNSNPSLYINRGAAYADKQYYDLAIADHNRAVELCNNCAFAYINRGYAYEMQRNYDQAIQDFTTAIRINDQNPWAYNNRSTAYHSKKEYDRAILDSSQAIRLRQHPIFFFNRGNVYSDMGLSDQAVADWSKSIQLGDATGGSYYQRGQVFYRRRAYTEAIHDFSEAIRAGMNEPLLFFDRGEAYQMIKRYDLAVEDYSRAIQVATCGQVKSPIIFNTNTATKETVTCSPMSGANDYSVSKAMLGLFYDHRSFAYARNDEYDLAIADMTQVIEILGSQPWFYDARGEIFLQKGDISLAMKDFEHAIQINPQYAPAQVNLGRAYHLNGEYDQAIATYNLAIENSNSYTPTLYGAFWGRGDAFLAEDYYDKAIEDFSKAIELINTFPDAYYRRGLAYLAKSDRVAAMTDFQRYIALFPDSSKRSEVERLIRELQ